MTISMTTKLFGLLELQQNPKRHFVYEYLKHIEHYYIRNKKLLRANFWSNPISTRIDKISTRMC
jgi:hypothetical protein